MIRFLQAAIRCCRRLLYIACVSALLPVGVWAQGPAHLVKNINRGADPDASSFPSDFVSADGVTYFTADDGVHGCEPWRSDGTEEGTWMVDDINPGPAGSCGSIGQGAYPLSLILVGPTLFVRAKGPSGNFALLKIGGTPIRTVVVKEFDLLQYPQNLTAVGEKLFFSVYDSTSLRYTLWRSDGTDAGTAAIREFTVGLGQFNALAGTLSFSVNTGPGVSSELWKSDGSETCTVAVAGVPPNVYPLGELGGALFFTAEGAEGFELWKTDGTGAGTMLVKDINPGPASSYPGEATAAGETLFFAASDPVNGWGFWKTDGTTEGTVRVDHGAADLDGLQAADVVSIDGQLFFTSNFELWKDEATGRGPTLLKRFVQDPPFIPGPGRLTAVGHTLFFTAPVLGFGEELWKSDGTADGTVMVKDINPGAGNASIGSGDPFGTSIRGTGDVLLFSASDGTHGVELWRSDGTEAGTVLVKDINPGVGGSTPDALIAANDRLFFTAFEPEHGRELWVSDGTESGTSLVRDAFPGAGGSLDLDGDPLLPPGQRELTRVGDIVFFRAEDPSVGVELWRSDGSEPGTTVVKDLAPGPHSSNPLMLTEVRGRLFFVTPGSGNDNGYHVWASDGTDAGTQPIKDLGANELTRVGELLFFVAPDGLGGGPTLWRTEGPPAAIEPVRRFVNVPRNLTAVGETLFFLLDHFEFPSGSVGLWKTDGTDEGTHELRRIQRYFCNQNAGRADSLTAAGGNLFFVAFEIYSGEELWVSDGTPGGTHLVKDINPLVDEGECDVGQSSVPRDLTPVNGKVFFSAFEPGHGEELWMSDGTESGTVLVKDINPGGHSSPRHLANVNGILLFSADDGASGRELWTSDGTEAGTMRLQDIAAGAGSGDPASFTLARDSIFFTADDGSTGRELWALPLSALPPTVTPSVPTPTPSAGSSSVCAGDCNRDDDVQIDELVHCVEMAVARVAPSDCMAVDGDHNQRVTVNELVLAVGNALYGCR